MPSDPAPVPVGTYSYRHEAEFARATLQGAGIECVLVGDDAGGAYAGLSFTRPITLLVRPDQLDDAKMVLRQEGADGPMEG